MPAQTCPDCGEPCEETQEELAGYLIDARQCGCDEHNTYLDPEQSQLVLAWNKHRNQDIGCYIEYGQIDLPGDLARSVGIQREKTDAKVTMPEPGVLHIDLYPDLGFEEA